ncbi:hypothetical protein [Gorillibacterium massiliense]|uniref:hypothetical protein n=1 Tax=Gorillibacterium massiliense TaxID=1280390 RepID=UPI0012DEAAA0|nr:hypothetical protein [Gorillibacterium massiliense]
MVPPKFETRQNLANGIPSNAVNARFTLIGYFSQTGKVSSVRRQFSGRSFIRSGTEAFSQGFLSEVSRILELLFPINES